MKHWIGRSIGLGLCACLAAPVFAAPAEPAVRGAKELFFDPGDPGAADSGAGVTSAQPPAAVQPVAPSPALPAPPAAPPAKSTRGTAKISVVAAKHTVRPLPRHAALGIRYWVELMDHGDAPGTRVTDSRIFHSGERIRLHLASNSDGQVWLIQHGASGEASVLFPDPGKGLAGGHIVAAEELVLPGGKASFRFDETPGKELITVLFARQVADLEQFPVKPEMNPQESMALARSTQPVRGSKDLFVETESQAAEQIGTYGVNVAGQPVVLDITLEHH